jgi:methylphosphotriester-DNA--protein-cysteine methyltransferase
MRRWRFAKLFLAALLMLSPALAMAQAVPQATGEETVYVTKTGKKYHLETCPNLKHSKVKMPIKLKDAVKAGYAPCKVCHPPTLPKENQ